MRKGQRRSSVLVTHTDVLPDQQGTHEVQRHISHHANALGHFHIAASINPNTGKMQPFIKLLIEDLNKMEKMNRGV